MRRICNRIIAHNVRYKHFPSFEKPSLIGSVLRPRILSNINKALMSTEDNIAKRFLADESETAVLYTADRLCKLFQKYDINYAIVGGFALNVHGFKRQTCDVDVLLTPENFEKFQKYIVYNGVTPRFRDAKRAFRDPVTNVGIDILIAGEFPRDGKEGAVPFPVPSLDNVTEFDGTRIINLQMLINLKLTSYLSLKNTRMKDRTDVAGLVKHLSLGSSFAQFLSESVRAEYLAIVQEVADEEARELGA